MVELFYFNYQKNFQCDQTFNFKTVWIFCYSVMLNPREGAKFVAENADHVSINQQGTNYKLSKIKRGNFGEVA